MITYRLPRRSYTEGGLLRLACCSASLLLLLTGLWAAACPPSLSRPRRHLAKSLCLATVSLTPGTHDGNGAVIGFNDDWKDGQTQPLFAMQLNPTNDREAALVAFLAPGNYTAVVRGKGDATGVALVEAYRVL